MPFDGLTATYLVHELQELIGAKVERVHQPHRDMILLHMRAQRENIKLLISSNAVHARLHITAASFTNPLQPPLFCMVMRKHLEGARISEILQTPMERSFCFVFTGLDELGRQTEKRLYVEIMGKHSNIVLTNENDLILDGIKRYTHEVSRHREILPGELYVPPPEQDKYNLTNLSQEAFSNTLFQALTAKKLSNILSNVFLGLSSQAAKELLARADIPEDMRGDEVGDYELLRLWQAWEELKPSQQPQSTVMKIDGLEFDFFPYTPVYLSTAEQASYGKLSEAIDSYYTSKETRERFSNIQHELMRAVRVYIDKALKKHAAQEQDILTAEDAAIFRIYGEILTANLWQLPERAAEVTLDNFYDNTPINIPLEKEHTIAVNAQKYFKKYNKAKQTLNYLTAQIQETKKELAYLREVETALELAGTLEDLQEVRKELEQESYLKAKQTKDKKKKEPQQNSPLSFQSADGFSIYVGKNNLQNDRLTLRFAKPEDIWLHTKDIPGSHVIIRSEGKAVPHETILFAAELAAKHSKARFGSQVPVDYTEVKNVKKPSGAKPGYVIYEKQKTVYVKP